MTGIWLLALFLLLALNAFFVLAEFAIVKIRGTQIDALEQRGVRNAAMLRHIHANIDEYLAVCQLGITFASIALGYVGEPAFARMLKPLLGEGASAHAISIGVSYIVVSYLHILVGEQVPKSMALRVTEPAALWSAPALRFFRIALYLPLLLLNSSATLILKLLRLPPASEDTAPSEAEVRLILERSQQEGMMPFRRLLLVENVFDFGGVRVKDEMKPIEKVALLNVDRPWEENRDRILHTTFSRYPLFEGDPPRPIGVVHLKDLLYKDTPWPDPVDLRGIARKSFVTTPDTMLEQLLTDMRRRRAHMALVQNADGQVCGVITMEDIIEQLVGAIEDEFEQDAPLRLGDVLADTRILKELSATTSEAAIAEIIGKCDTSDVPLPKTEITKAVLDRERTISTYLGEGLAVPHARLDCIKQSYVFVARSGKGVRFGESEDHRANVLMLLLTPSAMPRAQIRLLSRIAALRESPYAWDRILTAETSAELLEAVRGSDEMLTT